jgi:hypothetical protein
MAAGIRTRASVVSLIALYDGDVQQTLAYGQQAATGDDWISMMGTAFMVLALIDRGAIDQARAMLASARRNGGQARAPWRAKSCAKAWTWPTPLGVSPSPTGPGGNSLSLGEGPAAMPRGDATR